MIVNIDLLGGLLEAVIRNGERSFISHLPGVLKSISLREDSRKPSTLAEIKKILRGSKLDFLFIDGDRSYEGVGEDFEIYFIN